MSRRLRILSSDDKEGQRALLFGLLTGHGHEVAIARNSDEVFRNLDRTIYDLLILDVSIQGINGYKVTERIFKSMLHRPKVLIFAPRGIKAEELQFTLPGADAIINKTTPCNRIINAIEDLFVERAAGMLPTPVKIGCEPLLPETQIQVSPPHTGEKLNDDLLSCLSEITRMEDLINHKNMRYEEFARDLLKEKQRTEKNYLEFKRMENEVIKLRNWSFILIALAIIAVIRLFFQLI